jgi:predicted nucleic acid-binding protein
MAIPSCLVDTNILLRMTRRSDPQHQLVDMALAKLASQGVAFHYTHQNIAELWNAMTRPLTRNGLGLTVADAEREVRAIEAGMTLLRTAEPFTGNGGESLCSMASWVFRCTTRDWRRPCTCMA